MKLPFLVFVLVFGLAVSARAQNTPPATGTDNWVYKAEVDAQKEIKEIRKDEAKVKSTEAQIKSDEAQVIKKMDEPNQTDAQKQLEAQQLANFQVQETQSQEELGQYQQQETQCQDQLDSLKQNGARMLQEAQAANALGAQTMKLAEQQAQAQQDAQTQQQQAQAQQQASLQAQQQQAQSSAATTSPQSVSLARGLSAEKAGNLEAAYQWYFKGSGLDFSSQQSIAENQVPKLDEPAESYEFACLISLARVAEKRVIANPSDYCENNNDDMRHYVVADAAYRAAQGILLGTVGTDGTYSGYTNDRLEQIMEQSSALFHNNNQERADAEAARMSDEENTMSAISQAAQSAASAIERAPAFQPSVPPAEANAGPQAISVTTSGNQLADRCNNDQTYLRWVTACRNNVQGANQGPCYCAAAALLNCYIDAAPNDPSVGSWKQSRDSALANARSVGQSCDDPSSP